ncbi:MAG: GH3 auxin-responsive promoter family protein [Bacteroidota bacterium]|nr:GH3 auxin-responsive promoter family protein [Bacteroidota bacterium]
MNTLIGNPLNSFFSWYMEKRIHEIEEFIKEPIRTQEKILFQNLEKAKNTAFGLNFGFKEINSPDQFKGKVPLHEYHDLSYDIERMKKGVPHVLWPGYVSWFAQSSGTVSGVIKHIPISKESLMECHYKGGKDLLSLYYRENPSTSLFRGKHLIASGSLNSFTGNKKTIIGDLSAIIMQHLPWWCEWRRSPRGVGKLTSKDWNEKLNYICDTSARDDIHLIAGVPSWILMIIKRIIDQNNVNNIHEVWPNFELFLHGGTSINSYLPLFQELFGKPINYYQNYNATEGYFGLQQCNEDKDMLLMLDYGIYYEFIKKEDWHNAQPNTISLEDVELNEPYEMVITTNGGLWRYRTKDTILFTQTYPFKIKVCGRTQLFLNQFGEEVMVDHLEQTILEVQKLSQSRVNEFIVSFNMSNSKFENVGQHHWVIEFEKMPNDIYQFTRTVDSELQKSNIDYKAKRKNNNPLGFPKVTIVEKGSFFKWMKKRGKLGGQHKVPRIDGSKIFINEIIKISNTIC